MSERVHQTGYGYPQTPVQAPYPSANAGAYPYGAYGAQPTTQPLPYPNVTPPFSPVGVPGVGPAAGNNIANQIPGMLPIEQSYIENILRLNKGKVAAVYMRFEESANTPKVFVGVIEAAGRDHIILSDPQTGKRYLLLMIYLDYITFDEEIDYTYPY